MKMREIVSPSFQICETAAFLIALGENHVMLREGRIDEAGFWKGLGGGIKSAADAAAKLGSLIKTSAPVEAFDTKADELLSNIKTASADRFPKITAAVEKYAEWAKANPVKQGLIIGVLTAVASLLAGPAGGAAAGYVLRFASELLKGEKVSTAAAKGVGNAALGLLAGVGFKELGNFFGNVEVKDIPGIKTVKNIVRHTIVNGMELGIDLRVPSEMEDTVIRSFNEIEKCIKSGRIEQAQVFFDELQNKFNSIGFRQSVHDRLANNVDLIQTAQVDALKTKKTFGMIGAAIQGMLNTQAPAKGTQTASPAADPAI